MTQTFIAVDYPMAMFGYKKSSAGNADPFVRNAQDIDRLTSWDAADDFALPRDPTAKQLERKNVLKAAQRNDFKDVQGAKEFKAFSRHALLAPNTHIACCSSLDAVMKYANYLHTQNNVEVSRLIVLGHGNKGIMAVGAGRADMDAVPQAPFKPGDPAKAPRVREISVNNKDEWRPMFQQAANSFRVDDAYDMLFIYLLGCSTGAGRKSDDKSLLHKVAKHVAAVTQLSTVVVGPREHLQEDHLMAFLAGMDDLQDRIGLALTGNDGATDYECVLGEMRYRAVKAD